MSQPAGQPGAEAKGSEAVPKKPPVPETLKKKRISYLELKARRIARKPLIKKKSRTIRKLEFKKGQKYAKEYRQRERRLVIQEELLALVATSSENLNQNSLWLFELGVSMVLIPVQERF